jgi:hypothetical protein
MPTDHEAMAAQVVASVRGFVKRLVAPITAKADRTAATVESLERRASRHAEHLQRLEDRVRKLETK